jgi:hypothetical protein
MAVSGYVHVPAAKPSGKEVGRRLDDLQIVFGHSGKNILHCESNPDFSVFSLLISVFSLLIPPPKLPGQCRLGVRNENILHGIFFWGRADVIGYKVLVRVCEKLTCRISRSFCLVRSKDDMQVFCEFMPNRWSGLLMLVAQF